MNPNIQLPPQPSPQQRFESEVKRITAHKEMNVRDERKIKLSIKSDSPGRELVDKAANGHPEWVEIINCHYINEDGVASDDFIVEFYEYIGGNSDFVVEYRSSDDGFERHIRVSMNGENPARRRSADSVNTETGEGEFAELNKIVEGQQDEAVQYEDDPEAFDALLNLLRVIRP